MRCRQASLPALAHLRVYSSRFVPPSQNVNLSRPKGGVGVQYCIHNHEGHTSRHSLGHTPGQCVPADIGWMHCGTEEGVVACWGCINLGMGSGRIFLSPFCWGW